MTEGGKARAPGRDAEAWLPGGGRRAGRHRARALPVRPPTRPRAAKDRAAQPRAPLPAPRLVRPGPRACGGLGPACIEGTPDDRHFNGSEAITASRGGQHIARALDPEKKADFKPRMAGSATEASFMAFKEEADCILPALGEGDRR